MLKRIKMTCWQCQDNFELTLELQSSPRYQRECPYCGANCIIDLNPYRSTIVENLKDGQEFDPQIEQLNIPPLVPTTQPKEESTDAI